MPVTDDQFISAVKSGAGAAGFDGWTAKELKGLASHAPPLLSGMENPSVFLRATAYKGPGLGSCLRKC